MIDYQSSLINIHIISQLIKSFHMMTNSSPSLSACVCVCVDPSSRAYVGWRACTWSCARAYCTGREKVERGRRQWGLVTICVCVATCQSLYPQTTWSRRLDQSVCVCVCCQQLCLMCVCVCVCVCVCWLTLHTVKSEMCWCSLNDDITTQMILKKMTIRPNFDWTSQLSFSFLLFSRF